MSTNTDEIDGELLDADSDAAQELIARQRSNMMMRRALAELLGNEVPGGSADGLQDYYDIFDWPKNPSAEDYLALALRNAYAFAATFLPPIKSWSDNPRIVDDAEEDDGTEFENDVERLDRKVGLWNTCKRGDMLAGVGDFGVLVLEFDDVQESELEDADDKDVGYHRPATSGNVEQLLGIRPFSKVSIETIETDQFGNPEFYHLDVNPEAHTEDDTVSYSGPDYIRVHHSRIIHIHSDRLLDDEIRGIPRQQPVVNNIIDIEKARGSAVAHSYRGANWGLHLNIPKDVEFDDDAEDDLMEQIYDWEVGLEQILKTQAAEINAIGGEEIDPQPVIEPNIEEIASMQYMPPKSVLRGNEVGNVATNEDLQSWYNDLMQRRREFINSTIVRPVIDRLVKLGVISSPVEGQRSYSIEWPSFYELPDDVEAKLQNQRAKTGQKLGLSGNKLLEYVKTGTLPSELEEDGGTPDASDLSNGDENNEAV